VVELCRLSAQDTCLCRSPTCASSECLFCNTLRKMIVKRGTQNIDDFFCLCVTNSTTGSWHHDVSLFRRRLDRRHRLEWIKDTLLIQRVIYKRTSSSSLTPQSFFLYVGSSLLPLLVLICVRMTTTFPWRLFLPIYPTGIPLTWSAAFVCADLAVCAPSSWTRKMKTERAPCRQ
jgi:hypothetical protein